MHTPRQLAALVLGVAAFAGAACAPAAGAGDTGEPVVTAVPVLLASADLRLPVADYLSTTEEAELFARARVTLIRRCLAGFGVDYAVEVPATAAFGPRSLTDRRYGITDADLAARAGYGMAERDPSRQPAPGRPDIGPDGEAALFGDGPSVVRGIAVPPGGCAGQADRALDRSVPAGADPELGQRLQFTSFEASKEDSRVRDVFAAWSSCMAAAGHHYPDPLAAAGDPGFTRGGADAAQVAVATADIRCKRATNLVGVWFTVESAYQRRAIDRDATAFAACADALAARQRTASAVESPG